MISAVHGNESTLTEDIEGEKLQKADDNEDSFGRGARHKKTRTHYGDEEDDYMGHFQGKDNKSKKGNKGSKGSKGINSKLLSSDGEEDKATPSTKKTSTTRLSPLKGSPNKLRAGFSRQTSAGDPCCECLNFISFAKNQTQHNHYCKGGCGMPMHGLCGMAQSEDQQMNRVCTKCQNKTNISSSNAMVNVQTSTISNTNISTTKKRKEKIISTTESTDGEEVIVTKDTQKEGQRKAHGGVRAGGGRKKKEKPQEELDAIREEVMSNERQKQGLVRLAYMLNVKYKNSSQTFVQLLLGVKSNEESGGLLKYSNVVIIYNI